MNEQACPTEQQLSLFLESGLSPEDCADIDLHVALCPLCQSSLKALSESHLGIDPSLDEPLDESVSNLISKLSVLGPDGLEHPAVLTSSGVRFPGPVSDEAPLGELGPYQIKEQIADGASGLLYRAIDTRVHHEVAIKVLRSELASQEQSRKRLTREARAVAGLNHPNVVTLFEFGDEPGFPPYLVMEFVPGETLSAKLRRLQTLPLREAVETTIAVSRALASAHQQNLVHRNVRPSNVLLAPDGTPRITDFGLALLDDEHSDLTREGSLAGTPAYISPEQIIDPHNVDGRSDTYSLGVVLYQLVTGELPFHGVVRMTLLAVLHKEPQPPSHLNDEIPRDVETIILKAMAKDAGRRYQTADAFADDLQRWLDGIPITARPIGRVERLVRWCKRNRRIAALSAAVAILLTTVTVGSLIASINLSRARAEADDAKEIAERQRDQAFSTLHKLVYEVNEKFEDDTTSIDQIQQSVLDISVRGLTDIARTADGAGQTDVSTAAVHLRLGNVLDRLADGLKRDRMKADEAKQHLDRGEAILKRLGGTQSAQWPVVKHCIEARWFRSDYAHAEQDFGQSLKFLREAVAIAGKARKRWPDKYEAGLMLGHAHSRLSDQLYLLGEDDVVPATEAAIKVWDGLEARYSDQYAVREGAAVSRDTLATQYYEAGELQNAGRLFKDLIARCETELSIDDTRSQFADWLILAHHVMSDIENRGGDSSAAIDHLIAALKANERYEHWVLEEVIIGIRKDLDGLRPPGSGK